MYAVIAKDDPISKRVEKKIKGLLGSCDSDNPKFVFTIGGDGTILRALHKYQDNLDDITLFGIHTGHLGFFMDFDESDIENMISSIEDNSYRVHEYNIAEAELYADGKKEKYFALNEFQIVKVDRVIVMDVFIDGDMFETFRGTGLCFSTPGGSTGMNKSLGGAIVDPELDALQMTELASINSNSFRTICSPLVLSRERLLKLKMEEPVTVDFCYDHLSTTIANMTEFKCKLSSRKIRIAYNRNNTFFERVKNAFL